jgi:predicted nucleotidyltransferase
MDNRVQISTLSESIIKALLYYDLFDYPLTPEEIFKTLPSNHVTPHDVQRELDVLVKRTLVFKLGNFFSVQRNPVLETKRIQGNLLAGKHLKIATRKAQVIARFPFVRSVMISGSLSKGYADEKSDIDFFVITQPGRLWITRTLLALYRRLAYFNSRRYFCINYFIDEEHLEIEEKNLFTATELTTLVPLYGLAEHQELMRSNPWVRNFLPNYQLRLAGPSLRQAQGKRKTSLLRQGYGGQAGTSLAETPRPVLKRLAERFINFFFPNKLDNLLMGLALRRWKKMYGQSLGSEEFKLAFKSRRSVSKSHPLGFQNKIIARYEDRVRSFIQSIGP